MTVFTDLAYGKLNFACPVETATSDFMFRTSHTATRMSKSATQFMTYTSRLGTSCS